ncbi:MAG: nucleotidyltransferase family protein [Fimbriimonadaceae bacterium]
MAGIDVVIPAGGKITDEFARVAGVSSKALIKYEDVSVLKRTIQALRGSRNVGRIVIVGNADVLAAEEADLVDAALPAGNSSVDNIKIALDHLANLDFPPDRVLVVTADLPFLTTATVDEFLGLCIGYVDLYVPIINKNDWDEKFPGADASFVRLLDGEWTTGCVYIISTRGFKIAQPFIEKVFQLRKSKSKMAMMLGWKFLWDYMNKKLTVTDIEKKIEELVKINGMAVPGAPAEVAYDIDYLDDYHYTLSVFRARAAKEAAEREAAEKATANQ